MRHNSLLNIYTNIIITVWHNISNKGNHSPSITSWCRTLPGMCGVNDPLVSGSLPPRLFVFAGLSLLLGT